MELQALIISLIVISSVYIWDCIKSKKLLFIYDSKHENKFLRFMESTFMSTLCLMVITLISFLIVYGFMVIGLTIVGLCIISPGLILCFILWNS